ncbi:cytosine permease [Saccharopolyspora sp. 5N102]|uniref:cytosine permease n=1 Tax=Saccharopolyspora sp. 5N102 TaxID=3375155 RepID=UPI00378ABA03
MTRDQAASSPDAGRGPVETRSIDFVPLAERHGRAWHLFPVWFAGGANVGTLVVGTVGIAFGGTLLWTLVALTLGTLSAPSSWPRTPRRGRGWAFPR